MERITMETLAKNAPAIMNSLYGVVPGMAKIDEADMKLISDARGDVSKIQSLIDKYGIITGDNAKNHLKTVSKTSRINLLYRCGNANCDGEPIFQREARGISRFVERNANADKIYCEKCSRTQITNEGKRYKHSSDYTRTTTALTLKDWLIPTGNAKTGKNLRIELSDFDNLLPGEKIDKEVRDQNYIDNLKKDGLITLSEAENIYQNDQHEYWFRCTIHHDNYKRKVTSLCRPYASRIRPYRLPCCRKDTLYFSLQDWYMLFYEYPIEFEAKDFAHNGILKYFTGKRLKEFYQEAQKKGKNPKSMTELSYYSNDVIWFANTGTGKKGPYTCKFQSQMWRVTSGRRWCETPSPTGSYCVYCNNKPTSVSMNYSSCMSDEAKLDKFLKVYALNNNGLSEVVNEISNLKTEINQLQSKIVNHEKFIQNAKKSGNNAAVAKTELQIAVEKEEKANLEKEQIDKELYVKGLQNKWMRETCHLQKRYTSRIIKLLEQQA